MQNIDKLSKGEFSAMLAFLKRFSTTEMDQFEHWKIETEFGKVYIELARVPSGSEEAYVDLNYLLSDNSL